MRALLLYLIAVLPTIVLAQAPETYVPVHERDQWDGVAEGPELVMMYFGSPNCGPCLTDGMKDAVERAKVTLAAYAAEQDMRFFVIGVVPDGDVEAGYAFLEGSGRFDEVVIGRSILNSSLLTHGAAYGGGLPGVVVYERNVAFTNGGRGIEVTKPEYRAAMSGDTTIMEWSAAGAPLE